MPKTDIEQRILDVLSVGPVLSKNGTATARLMERIPDCPVGTQALVNACARLVE